MHVRLAWAPHALCSPHVRFGWRPFSSADHQTRFSLPCCYSKLPLLQEFAAEKELCWDLCMALGLCRRHSALAQALAKATLSERHSPMEWQASAQVGSYSLSFRQPKRLLSAC